jgi:DNA adenine methylase
MSKEHVSLNMKPGATTEKKRTRAGNYPPLVSCPAQALPKPPLKWAGGKRWQLPYLRPIWERHQGRRLVEPFCGGLAIALGLTPKRALLNDVNPHLVHFYRWLQRGLMAKIPMRNSERLYYSYRRRFNALIRSDHDDPKVAALFYYLNRTGYNGLCRFNRKGEFNVPFGQYVKITYTRDFTPYRAIFRGWDFTSQDFEKIPLEEGDFVYADPPYDVEFTSYAKDGFTWEDQRRTADWLATHKGPVVLVNQATTRIVTLYRRRGYKLSFLKAPRRISCTGDRRPAPEVFAFRNV